MIYFEGIEMNVLLTGGAGFIGSHTAVLLQQQGFQVVILDNFSNSEVTVLEKMELITGKPFTSVSGDVREVNLLVTILENYKIDAVIHFAGLKSVAESALEPLQYYSNNVLGTISLLEAMNKAGVHSLVFSSSATVYGAPKYLPIDEDHPVGPTNPYGQGKLQAEQILADLSKSSKQWRIISLRYFNPSGAHETGLIGESPRGEPNNLMPVILKVAGRQLGVLKVFGADYETRDGTGIRDYIHIMDVAQAHLDALRNLSKSKGFEIFNLGTGQGFSVIEILKTFEKINDIQIPYEICTKRDGDVAACFSDSRKASVHLQWSPKRSLEEMCKSAWQFYKQDKING